MSKFIVDTISNNIVESDEDDIQLPFTLDDEKDSVNVIVKSSDEEENEEENEGEDENSDQTNVFGGELDTDLSKSPFNIPNSVGSIAEENVCILSKFS